MQKSDLKKPDVLDVRKLTDRLAAVFGVGPIVSCSINIEANAPVTAKVVYAVNSEMGEAILTLLEDGSWSDDEPQPVARAV